MPPSIASHFIAVTFDRNGITGTAKGGKRSCAEAAADARVDDVVWLASMGKLSVALAGLAMVEKLGIGLDDHEALIKYLPELKQGNGRLSTKVFLGPDGKGWNANGEMLVRDQKQDESITLRYLFTQTAGWGLGFADKNLDLIVRLVLRYLFHLNRTEG